MNLGSTDAPLTPSLSPSEEERVPVRAGEGLRGTRGEPTVQGILSLLQPGCCATFASDRSALLRRPELLLFVVLLALFNVPVLSGSCFNSMVFMPQAVQCGEWWRLFTHPFVHVTWYHLLLDGAAFLALYHSLLETSIGRRLLYMLAAGAGSLLVSWLTAPAISSSGLCGLSGVAHGLTAVSALELLAGYPPTSTEHRIGQVTFILVVAKAAVEALSGRMFFTFLHFGLMGDPVAVSHAGGIIGGLLAMLLVRPRCAAVAH